MEDIYTSFNNYEEKWRESGYRPQYGFRQCCHLNNIKCFSLPSLAILFRILANYVKFLQPNDESMTHDKHTSLQQFSCIGEKNIMQNKKS